MHLAFFCIFIVKSKTNIEFNISFNLFFYINIYMLSKRMLHCIINIKYAKLNCIRSIFLGYVNWYAPDNDMELNCCNIGQKSLQVG